MLNAVGSDSMVGVTLMVGSEVRMSSTASSTRH